MKKMILMVCLGIIIVAFINFFSFLDSSMQLGGDAVNGYEKNGKYYISGKSKVTEVSKDKWENNYQKATIFYIAQPIAFLCIVYLLFIYGFPSLIYRQNSRVLVDAADEVINSGAIILSGKCSGKIGAVYFSGALININIYPGGIIIKPLFMPQFAIRKGELIYIDTKSKVVLTEVNIHHNSQAVSSPIILRISDTQKFFKVLIEFGNEV